MFVFLVAAIFSSSFCVELRQRAEEVTGGTPVKVLRPSALAGLLGLSICGLQLLLTAVIYCKKYYRYGVFVTSAFFKGKAKTRAILLSIVNGALLMSSLWLMVLA